MRPLGSAVAKTVKQLHREAAREHRQASRAKYDTPAHAAHGVSHQRRRSAFQRAADRLDAALVMSEVDESSLWRLVDQFETEARNDRLAAEECIQQGLREALYVNRMASADAWRHAATMLRSVLNGTRRADQNRGRWDWRHE